MGGTRRPDAPHHHVLHLTARSDQRPCGARATDDGLRRACPDGWLRRMERRLPGGGHAGHPRPLTWSADPRDTESITWIRGFRCTSGVAQGHFRSPCHTLGRESGARAKRQTRRAPPVGHDVSTPQREHRAVGPRTRARACEHGPRAAYPPGLPTPVGRGLSAMLWRQTPEGGSPVRRFHRERTRETDSRRDERDHDQVTVKRGRIERQASGAGPRPDRWAEDFDARALAVAPAYTRRASA